VETDIAFLQIMDTRLSNALQRESKSSIHLRFRAVASGAHRLPVFSLDVVRPAPCPSMRVRAATLSEWEKLATEARHT
jgi:hypothetical protein